jgi:hypothetical protein
LVASFAINKVTNAFSADISLPERLKRSPAL